MSQYDTISIKEILYILRVIVELILTGLSLAESIARTAESFDISEDTIRQILGMK
jgi:hypothetical protein